MVFGVLTVVMGGLCALYAPLMLLSQLAAARVNPSLANPAAMVPAIATYAALGVALIWLGIGSIQTRRWARALLLIFSWSWLLVGVLSVIITAFIMPKMLSMFSGAGTAHPEPLSSAIVAGIMIMTFLILGFVFVLAPTAWVCFYGSRHVKATCEARDGVTRWTDACPLPVLALCLWLAYSVPTLLLMPLMGRGVFPCFGTFVTGAPGTMLSLAVAILWGYVAWLLYRLDLRGWWLLLATSIVFTISALVTFARHDVTEMYELMGYPQGQLDQLRQLGLLSGSRMVWLLVVGPVPFLGYLLFVRRYFPARSHVPRHA